MMEASEKKPKVTPEELASKMNMQVKMSAAQEALTLCKLLWTEAMDTKESFNSTDSDLQSFIDNAENTILDPENLDMYKDPDSLLNDGNCPVFVKGDFSLIEGQAKSRKTFLSTLLVSLMLKDESSYSRFSTPTKCKKIVWIDTEQGMARTARIVKRLKRMGADTPRIIHASMRELGAVGRFKTLLYLIILHKPEFVLIDGVADLMTDPNSIPESVLIRQLLMTASARYDCHISAVLHTNEKGDSSSARGYVGSELIRKCSTVLHLEDMGNYTEVTYRRTRDERPDSFSLKVEDIIDDKGYKHAIPIVGDIATSASDNIIEDCRALQDFCKSRRSGVKYRDLIKFLTEERKLKPSTCENRVRYATKMEYIGRNGSSGLYYPAD